MRFCDPTPRVGASALARRCFWLIAAFVCSALASFAQEYGIGPSTVGLWHLNDVSSTILDAGVNGNNGIASGTEITGGKYGYARYFGGVSDYVTVPDNASFDFSVGRAFTAECWAKIDSLPTRPGLLIGRWDFGGDTKSEWQLTVSSAGLAFEVNSSMATGSPNSSVVVPPAQFPMHRWIHLACTWDGAARAQRLYLNGALLAETDSAVSTIPHTTSRFRIGSNGLLNYSFGYVDEVRLSSAVLLPSDFNVPNGSISGRALWDRDRNGAVSAADTARGGLKVWLHAATHDTAFTDSATTDGNGEYRFSHLDIGNYLVVLENESGWFQSYPAMRDGRRWYLKANLLGLEKDISALAANAWGYRVQPASRGGGGGTYNGYSIPTARASTDNGWYTSTSAAQSVTFTAASKFGYGTVTVSIDSAGLASSCSFFGQFAGDPAFHLIAEHTTSEQRQGVDFASMPLEIRGRVVEDRRESTAPLEGWKVILSGDKDTSVYSDADGKFVFRGIPWGIFDLSVETHAGWSQAAPSVLGTSADSAGTVLLGILRMIRRIAQDAIQYRLRPTLEGGGGGSFLGWSLPAPLATDAFAEYREVSTAASIVKIAATARPLAGSVTVQIDSAWGTNMYVFTGDLMDVRPRSASGRYALMDLQYVNEYFPLTIDSGYIFRIMPPEDLHGSVFNDADPVNGVWDPAEGGLPGRTMYAIGPVLDSTVTDAGGRYHHSVAQPGQYFIEEASRPGWYKTFPALDSLGAHHDSVTRDFAEAVRALHQIAADASRFFAVTGEYLGGGGLSWMAGSAYAIPWGLAATPGHRFTLATSPQGVLSVSGASLGFPGSTLSATLERSGKLSGFVFAGEYGGASAVATDEPAAVAAAHDIGNAIMHLSFTAWGGPGGSISPAGVSVVPYAGTQVFTIAPDPGYRVDSVFVDGLRVDSVGSFTFANVTASHTIHVIFGPATVAVTVQTTPPGRAVIVDSVAYVAPQTFGWYAGSVHTIASDSVQNETAGSRYCWAGWNDGGARRHAVTAPSVDATYAASFTEQFLLTLNAGPGGSVSPPSGWRDSASVVSIAATPSLGYSFTGWSGVGPGSLSGPLNPANITLTSAITETAQFTRLPVHVMIATNPAGRSYSVDGVLFTGTQEFVWPAATAHVLSTVSPQGDTLTRSLYGSWSDGGGQTHSVAPASDTMMTLHFSLEHYLSMTAAAGGAVAPASGWFAAGQSVLIFAKADSGYGFSEWNGTGTGSYTGFDDTSSLSMGGPITEAASFSRRRFIISSSAGAHGTITPEGNVDVDYSSAQSFSFTAEPGYRVDSVVIDGFRVDSLAGYTFHDVRAAHSIRVSFTRLTFVIMASAAAHGAINPSGQLALPYGSAQRFHFLADPGFEVQRVLVDGVIVDSSEAFTFFDVTGPRAISVEFGKRRSSVALSVSQGADHDTLMFGVRLGATYGIWGADPGASRVDSAEGEVELPAPVPDGFDARFQDASGNLPRFGRGSAVDIRNLVGLAQRDSFLVRVQRSPAALPVAYRWTPAEVAAAFRGNVTIGAGSGARVDMKLADSLLIGDRTGTDVVIVADAPNLPVVYEAGWNLVSVPVDVLDGRAGTLFPGIAATPYSFNAAAGYVQRSTLEPGIGYWLKFPAVVQLAHLAGMERLEDTVAVEPGWNLVGTVSQAVSAASVRSIPAGMVTSTFFGYHAGYTVADTLAPMFAYWVKVNEAGSLIVGAAAPGSQSSRLRIEPTNELPPPPPGGGTDAFGGTPDAYLLGQNYPNPFNPGTTIPFELAEAAFVSLKVYNILGAEVANLVNAEVRAGSHAIRFDASGLASGIYFYRLQVGSRAATKKLLLMK
jgi:hypothetical protein